MKIKILFLLLFIISFILTVPVSAEFDSGIGASPWDTTAPALKKEKQLKPADNFIKVTAKYLNQSQGELNALWNRGYGRNEIIKLILISRKSSKPLAELIKDRDKKMKLSRLCEKNGINYTEILSEAVNARKEIDIQVEALPPPIYYGTYSSTPTPTPAP